MTAPVIAVLGGSGFYDLPGLEAAETVSITTPFGAPSAPIVLGRVAGRRVAFLARHGSDHGLLPAEVNTRANLHALKSVGATTVLSVSAVGSLREDIAPGDAVTPRQFIDWTIGRASSFFGEGVVAHLSAADPVCERTADVLADAARAEGCRVTDRATYVCIDGPRFSTRAESELFRAWGADLVGMTNVPEVFLAREAELCYATLALPTDYDCWRGPSEAVQVSGVLAVLRANVERARRVLARALAAIDPAAPCACQTSLDGALLTPPDRIPSAARARLGPILARRLARG